MTGTPKSSPLGTAQQWVLVLIAVVLAIGLVILRGGIQSESPMEQLARRSLDCLLYTSPSPRDEL